MALAVISGGGIAVETERVITDLRRSAKKLAWVGINHDVIAQLTTRFRRELIPVVHQPQPMIHATASLKINSLSHPCKEL